MKRCAKCGTDYEKPESCGCYPITLARTVARQIRAERELDWPTVASFPVMEIEC